MKHKFTKGNGKRKVTGRRKKGEKKPQKKADEPKKKPKKTSGTTKKKTGTTKEKGTTKTKSKKESKPKIGEAEPWQVALRRFATMCGKERTVTSIRKFVKEIQAQFSAKLKHKTPHIELIREIQEKLIPKANSTETKVQLPEWADLKKRCQEAAREKTVSKTVAKPQLKETALSGLKKK